jgi:hypothetical protein
MAKIGSGTIGERITGLRAKADAKRALGVLCIGIAATVGVPFEVAAISDIIRSPAAAPTLDFEIFGVEGLLVASGISLLAGSKACSSEADALQNALTTARLIQAGADPSTVDVENLPFTPSVAEPRHAAPTE